MFFFRQDNVWNGGVLVRIAVFIGASLGYNVCVLTINKKKGPMHLVITDTVSSILVTVLMVGINVIGRNEVDVFLGMLGMKICGYVLIVVGFCVFNEMVMLNFWGLGKNTQKEIMKRGSEEDGIVIGLVGMEGDEEEGIYEENDGEGYSSGML